MGNGTGGIRRRFRGRYGLRRHDRARDGANFAITGELSFLGSRRSTARAPLVPLILILVATRLSRCCLRQPCFSSRVVYWTAGAVAGADRSRGRRCRFLLILAFQRFARASSHCDYSIKADQTCRIVVFKMSKIEFVVADRRELDVAEQLHWPFGGEAIQRRSSI